MMMKDLVYTGYYPWLAGWQQGLLVPQVTLTLAGTACCPAAPEGLRARLYVPQRAPDTALCWDQPLSCCRQPWWLMT